MNDVKLSTVPTEHIAPRIAQRTAPKITADAIAQAALRLLNEVGLDGLTMRLIAKELGVQAAALYWHIKNKQQLLDAMATIMVARASADLAVPGPDAHWSDWLADWARGLRTTLLSYRDGARVFGGTSTMHPALYQVLERTLTTLADAGFTILDAARSLPVLLHYTVGFVIEEQARTGLAYDADTNPYAPDRIGAHLDPAEYPLLTQAYPSLFSPDTDASYEHGLQFILTGIRVVALPGESE